jgi:nicotinamidase-related amidase
MSQATVQGTLRIGWRMSLVTSAARHAHLDPVSPDNAMLLFVDQQEDLFSGIHQPQQTRNNLLALARSARLVGIPAVLTTALAAGANGPQLKELTETFTGQDIIDRTLINAWQDSRVHEAVTRTGRQK